MRKVDPTGVRIVWLRPYEASAKRMSFIKRRRMQAVERNRRESDSGIPTN